MSASDARPLDAGHAGRPPDAAGAAGAAAVEAATVGRDAVAHPASAIRPAAAVPAGAWLIVVLGCLSAFSPLAIDMYLPAFPRIAADLGVPVGRVPASISAFLVGLAVGQLVCGPLADRVGRRRPLLAGCGLFAAAGVASAFADSLAALLAARFVMGVGGAAGPVVARAVVRDLFDERSAARTFSMMMVVTGIAPVVAPAVGSLLLAWADWRAIFWVLAGFGVLCVAMVAASLPESLPPAGRVRGHAGEVAGRYLRLAADRRFVPFALAGGLAYGVLFAYISGSPFVFIDLFGLSPRAYSLLFATNSVGLFCGGRLNHWLVARVDSRRVLSFGCAANAIGGLALVGLTLAGSPGGLPLGGLPVFFGVLMATTATIGLILPNATAAGMAPFAVQAGTASALLGTTHYVVGAAAGALVGPLHDGTASPMAALIAGCGALCGLPLLFAPRRTTGS